MGDDDLDPKSTEGNTGGDNTEANNLETGGAGGADGAGNPRWANDLSLYNATRIKSPEFFTSDPE